MAKDTIRVAVAGAKGRMGQEVVKTVLKEEGMTFVCGIDSTLEGVDVGEVIGLREPVGPFFNSLAKAIAETRPDVLVDFTTPEAVQRHVDIALEKGVRPVVGTTGISSDAIARWDKLCAERGLGAIIAPNFAIGAVLMMKFASVAARYMPHVEIIELHHDRKLDAPSGTAVKTAELIAKAREELKQGHPEEKEVLEGARGGYYQGFRIHSVRLPGLVAHQEVIFGSDGQTLTIRHDSLNRQSFMPGVSLAIREVMKTDRLIYGLEQIID
ncbi:4-hydroxy-tetrahydrodipicolinate reductase [Bacillaceae bacterium]